MKQRVWLDYIGGMLLVFAVYIIVTIILWLLATLLRNSFLGSIGFGIIFFPGISQLFYLTPIVIHFWKKQRWEVLKGMGTGAVLMILVNAVCYSFVDSALRKW